MTDKTEELDGPELERIRGLMGEVVRKSSKREDTCVYRGEPKCYPVVSSGLFRKCPNSSNEAFDIGRVEQEIVDKARPHTALAEDVEILTQIQHFGGATNLIEFTDDHLIALFFASLDGHGTNGRVVLHWPESDTLVRPKPTMNRMVSQKSVFVRPRRGFIVPDADRETVVVPADLKRSILAFLERFHGISERTVYNDIHGFIRQQAPSRSRYAREFQDSLTRPRTNWMNYLAPCLKAPKIIIEMHRMRHAYHQRGMVYEDGQASMLLLSPLGELGPITLYASELNAEEIVELFTQLIEKKQVINDAIGHCRRGAAHLHQGTADLALSDFDEALARDEEMPEAYHGRANAYRLQGNADAAMADFDKALSLEPRLVAGLIDRANASRESGSLDQAIRDLDSAILIMKTMAYSGRIGVGDGYFYRAVARCVRQEWAEAKGDFEAARRDGVLVASSFRKIYGGVQAFQDERHVALPSAVQTILHVL